MINQTMTVQYWLIRWISRFALALRTRLVVEGREHIPDSGFLFVANHVSNWDPVIMALILWNRPVRALGKEELFTHPIWGRISYWCGGIPIRRGEPDREALAVCKTAVQAGLPLFVLPEGTRSRSGMLSEGKMGVVFLAQLTNAPIVPAAIISTKKIGWPWRRTTIRVRLGPAFTLDRKARRPEQRQALLDQTMITIARLLPPELRGVYSEASVEV